MNYSLTLSLGSKYSSRAPLCICYVLADDDDDDVPVMFWTIWW